jgi:SAM-dependent methyltransferase
MDAENLAFPGDSFDAVFCGFSIFFFDVPRALAEFRRVLKPGGLIGVTTWGHDDARWMWLGDLNKKYVPPMLAQAFANQPPPTADLKTSDGMRAVFEKAGYVNIQVTDETADFIYSDADEWLAVQWSHGNRVFLEMNTPEIRDKWIAEAFEHLNILKTHEGIPHRLGALYTLGGPFARCAAACLVGCSNDIRVHLARGSSCHFAYAARPRS